MTTANDFLCFCFKIFHALMIRIFLFYSRIPTNYKYDFHQELNSPLLMCEINHEHLPKALLSEKKQRLVMRIISSSKERDLQRENMMKKNMNK